MRSMRYLASDACCRRRILRFRGRPGRRLAQLRAKGDIKEGSDIAFSEYLLEHGGVAVVPGSAFGSEGYIRLSFATTMSNLENALRRIAKVLA